MMANMGVVPIMLLLVVFLMSTAVSFGQVPHEQEKYCQFFLGKDVGLCVKNECTGTNACSGGQICCPTGCNKMCVTPTAKELVVKDGVCPALPKKIKCGPRNKTDCAIDLDCGTSIRKKCCYNGCDNICTQIKICRNVQKFRRSITVRHKRRKVKCENCSCYQLWRRGKDWFRKACAKKQVAKGCCYFCHLNSIE